MPVCQHHRSSPTAGVVERKESVTLNFRGHARVDPQRPVVPRATRRRHGPRQLDERGSVEPTSSVYESSRSLATDPIPNLPTFPRRQ